MLFFTGQWKLDQFLFMPIVIICLVILAHLGRPMLEYDSDGEVIVVKSREPMFEWIGKPFYQHYEFPKDKLKGYRIKRFLLRRTMILEVDSRQRGTVYLKTPISYLGRGEVREIETSLKHAVKHNYKNSDTNAG